MSSTCTLLFQLWGPLLQGIILHFRFSTGDGFRTHHCVYDKVGWPSLLVRRKQYWMIFIYMALLHVLPHYLKIFISFKTCNVHTCSQESLILNIPTVKNIMGKAAFQVCPPQKWNDLQHNFTINHLISLDSFKYLWFNVLQSECIVIYDHIV